MPSCSRWIASRVFSFQSGFRRPTSVPRSIFLVRVTLPPSSATSLLDRPALAVVAAQVVVGLEHVGDAHVGAVVIDLFSGAEGDYAEEHDLGEAGGVLERRVGFHFSLGGVYPVHFVVFSGDTREFLRRLTEGIVERLGQEPGLEAVGVVEELALGAD